MHKLGPPVMTIVVSAVALLVLSAVIFLVDVDWQKATYDPPCQGADRRPALYVCPEVKISRVPKLKDRFTVTGTFTALRDHEYASFWLDGGVYLDGEDRWHGPMAEGEVKILTANFAFVKEGTHAISARANWDTSKPINLYVTASSGRRVDYFAAGGSPITREPEALRTVYAGRTYLVETALVLNTSEEPRIEFIQSWQDVERMQVQGLFPSELRYRWGMHPDLFSKSFLIGFWDVLRPQPGHLVAFDKADRLNFEDGVITGGGWSTYHLPSGEERANRPVSPVELRLFSREAQLDGVYEKGDGILPFRGVRTFEFTVDGRPLPPMTVDLKTPEEAERVRRDPSKSFVYLSPPIFEVREGHQFAVDIKLDSSIQRIHGIEAFLNFNPTYLEVVKIVGGTTSLSQIHSSYDNVVGALQHSRGHFSSAGVSGNFVIATVTFKAKAVTGGDTSTQVSFNSGSDNSTVVVLVILPIWRAASSAPRSS